MDNVVGDAELVGVLELTLLATVADDDAETVVGDVGLKSGGRVPDELADVRDVFRQALDWYDVC